MKLLFTLSRRYPWRTLLTLAGIAFAGISEGFGISALLPLLNTVFNQTSQASATAGSPPEWSRAIDQLVHGVLGTMGLTPTVAVLLTLFVACIVFKCLSSTWQTSRSGSRWC